VPDLSPPPRIVTLIIVTQDGEVLGRLDPFPVDTPWWQDVEPVVARARTQFGLDVTILRLLDTELPSAHGGAVTYLAEAAQATTLAVSGALDLRAWHGALTEDPRRQPYARPAGPAADLAWADAVLAGLDRARTAPAEQVRTWNLSSLWRLPTRDGAAWLKVVPSFFEHEGALIEHLHGELVPTVLGRERGRMLLADIPGEDQYDAARPELLEMTDGLVDLQARWSGRIVELIGLGLPDWRQAALVQAITDVTERAGPLLGPADRARLEAFVATLPVHLARIEACGLPDGLIHGDFHPGNVRGKPGRLVLLDWGDSAIGHPLLDQPAFLSRIDPATVPSIRERWHEAWRRALPGCDPARAAQLLAPVAAARQAVVYQRFLDSIEPSEHAYHRADVPDWLRRTAAILRHESALASTP
jgi:phosphotransferase family enzyme